MPFYVLYRTYIQNKFFGRVFVFFRVFPCKLWRFLWLFLAFWLWLWLSGFLALLLYRAYLGVFWAISGLYGSGSFSGSLALAVSGRILGGFLALWLWRFSGSLAMLSALCLLCAYSVPFSWLCAFAVLSGCASVSIMCLCSCAYASIMCLCASGLVPLVWLCAVLVWLCASGLCLFWLWLWRSCAYLSVVRSVGIGRVLCLCLCLILFHFFPKDFRSHFGEIN